MRNTWAGTDIVTCTRIKKLRMHGMTVGLAQVNMARLNYYSEKIHDHHMHCVHKCQNIWLDLHSKKLVVSSKKLQLQAPQDEWMLAHPW